jgi:predicted small integral membrane protein
MVKKKVKKLKINYEVPAFVLGILGIIFSATFVSPFAGFICGIIGLIESRKPTTRIGKQAKILNIIAVALSVILSVVAVLISINSNAVLAA